MVAEPARKLEVVSNDIRIFKFLGERHLSWGLGRLLKNPLDTPCTSLDKKVLERIEREIKPIINFDLTLPPYFAFDGTIPGEELANAREILDNDVLPGFYGKPTIKEIAHPEKNKEFLDYLIGFLDCHNGYEPAIELLARYGGPEIIRRLAKQVIELERYVGLDSLILF